MTTGALLVARVAMKPLATLNRPVLRDRRRRHQGGDGLVQGAHRRHRGAGGGRGRRDDDRPRARRRRPLASSAATRCEELVRNHARLHRVAAVARPERTGPGGARGTSCSSGSWARARPRVGRRCAELARPGLRRHRRPGRGERRHDGRRDLRRSRARPASGPWSATAVARRRARRRAARDRVRWRRGARPRNRRALPGRGVRRVARASPAVLASSASAGSRSRASAARGGSPPWRRSSACSALRAPAYEAAARPDASTPTAAPSTRSPTPCVVERVPSVERGEPVALDGSAPTTSSSGPVRSPTPAPCSPGAGALRS